MPAVHPTKGPAAMPVALGSPAPEFSLPDTAGAAFTLDKARGRKALLVFIPFPWTGTCDGEACTLRDHFADLNALDANVAIITTYPRQALKKWAAENGFAFPVLSDFWPHGRTAEAYGVLRSDGTTERAIFIIDKQGIIRYIDVHDINSRPPLEGIITELEKMKR